jgi:hypothetical protein
MGRTGTPENGSQKAAHDSPRSFYAAQESGYLPVILKELGTLGG